ncbi:MULTISPECIES: TcmI family type II polyketide cyclase [Micromonospora]|uniref:Polyketide synthase n=3 Tax=Micromonospora TaxID=1873 RepID=A0A9X0I1U1_9ACTN|nr:MULTISPECIES: TcmI family type II polyketide cyclase [Micromonospora]AIS85424.1 polyketide synthesis cyclase [Verrucosispora sp. MS100047]AEB45852.1 polyketide synthesis cyclase [Micromonospora maris AB-18-032]KUJ45178.1 polyketide synthase [Micromonospora maris]MBL6278133.1 TcmI family type II polyketide cyclase [Micromonospora fiedleri]RUL94776.1 TcmI family type II polyketide cyclase [Verrucosispora sp. FIM060022]
MDRTLIVAKVVPTAENAVAEIFAESDTTELPHLVGVAHRSLYRLHDLYVHLLETDTPGDGAVEAARDHPEFRRISARLRPYITPYLPDWRSPRDAMARCFYRFDAEPRREL